MAKKLVRTGGFPNGIGSLTEEEWINEKVLAAKEWNDESNDCPHCHSRNTKGRGRIRRCLECGKSFKKE